MRRHTHPQTGNPPAGPPELVPSGRNFSCLFALLLMLASALLVIALVVSVAAGGPAYDPVVTPAPYGPPADTGGPVIVGGLAAGVLSWIRRRPQPTCDYCPRFAVVTLRALSSPVYNHAACTVTDHQLQALTAAEDEEEGWYRS